MRLDLSGRRALVTGGANGIGRAISEALAACGAQVFVADLAVERPGERAGEFGAVGLEADVTDLDSLAIAFSAAGPLDIVVANAGTASVASLEATTPEIWERTLRVNLSGAFHTLRLAAAQMKPRRQITRKAQQGGPEPKPETMQYASYVLVFTTVPANHFSTAEVLEWYRVRWQIELVFKRLKTLAGLGALPKHDDRSARSWLYGKLLIALLGQKLERLGRDISPWGYRQIEAWKWQRVAGF